MSRYLVLTTVHEQISLSYEEQRFNDSVRCIMQVMSQVLSQVLLLLQKQP